MKNIRKLLALSSTITLSNCDSIGIALQTLDVIKCLLLSTVSVPFKQTTFKTNQLHNEGLWLDNNLKGSK